MPESVTLVGLPTRVPMARHIVAELLAGCPRLDDAALIVTELAGNAVQHSRSRDGLFTVTVDRKPGWARIEVADDGPLPVDRRHRAAPDEADEFGRGLMIVSALADRWGQEKHLASEVYWAELGWEEDR